MCHISNVIFESLKMIMSDSLLSRERACEDGRGLELWGKLHAEWRGSAPQVIAAKVRKFQDPQRCQSMQQLWEAPPSWEQLGSEVLMGGYVVLELVKAQALDKLVPQEQLSVIVSRPELAYYNAKLLCQSADGTCTWRNTGPAGLHNCSTQVGSRWRRQYGCRTARCFSSIRECSGVISVVAPPRIMCQACSWWRLGWRQRGEQCDHGSGKRQR